MAKWTALLLLAAGVMLIGVTGAFASDFSHDPEHSGDTVYHSGGEIVTLSQSASLAVVAGNSISCNNNRRHDNNSYMRRFSLEGVYGEARKFVVSNVTFGVEYAFAGGGTQPILVNLYTIPKGDLLRFANLTQIGSTTLQLQDQELTLVNVPFLSDPTVSEANAKDLVVEVFSPNGQAQGYIFFIGSNSLGQTGASYIAAAGCGAPEPRTTYSLGAPQMHIVLTVTGTAETQILAGSWGKIKAIYR